MITTSSEETVTNRATGSNPTSLVERIRIALGPALPGIVLDLIDAMSLTRIAGPLVSFPAGLAVGIWLSSYYPIAFHWRCMIALGSGFYTLTPGTEAIPLATILTCLGRFVEAGADSDKTPQPSAESANSATEDRSRESELATLAEVEVRRTSRSDASCPECGSASLRYGQVGQKFFPQGSSLWAKGHEIHAFVCLECGFVGHYLASDDLGQLDQPKS